jgi:exosortase A-associated hydrolase 2
MEPFFFGSVDKPLFGILHRPAATTGARGTVVLCPPFGQEYIRAHRAVRETAHRLCAMGFLALRFDYYGTGDSSGREEDGSPDQWLDDIDAALVEAREVGDGRRICLVGLRLGATLAALACLRHNDIDRLVLWDPIVHGRSYLAELVQRHQAVVAERPKPREYRITDPPTELLGTPVTPRVLAFLDSLDLLDLDRPPAHRVCVVSSDNSPSSTRLAARLREQGADVQQEQGHGLKVWLKEDEFIRVLVPQEIIGTIASWLAR